MFDRWDVRGRVLHQREGCGLMWWLRMGRRRTQIRHCGEFQNGAPSYPRRRRIRSPVAERLMKLVFARPGDR